MRFLKMVMAAESLGAVFNVNFEIVFLRQFTCESFGK